MQPELRTNALAPCCSKNGGKTSRISTSWDLVRNAESQGPVLTYRSRICMLTRFPGFVCTLKFAKCCSVQPAWIPILGCIIALIEPFADSVVLSALQYFLVTSFPFFASGLPFAWFHATVYTHTHTHIYIFTSVQ